MGSRESNSPQDVLSQVLLPQMAMEGTARPQPPGGQHRTVGRVGLGRVPTGRQGGEGHRQNRVGGMQPSRGPRAGHTPASSFTFPAQGV